MSDNHAIFDLFSATQDDDGDDDWGWDDSGGNHNGDVELASPVPKANGMSLKQRSPSIERRDLVQSPSITRQKGLQLPPASSARSTLGQPSLSPSLSNGSSNGQSQRITSLGAAPVAKKAPVRKAKQEDDIFASMGLSAQPKFNQAPRSTAVRSNASSGWGSAIASPPASAPSGGGDWGNDDDLDDLFDD